MRLNDPTQMTEVAAACTHNSLRRKLVATAVFLLAFAAVVMRTPKPDYVLSDPDAGIQFAGAGQIEFGEHPFIDFRSTYGPLTFYASFVAQRIGGGTIAAELLLCALAYSVAFLLLFFCAREMGGTLIGLICTALALAILPRFYKYYIFLGAALVMASLLGYIRRPGRGRLALPGRDDRHCGTVSARTGDVRIRQRRHRNSDRRALGAAGPGGVPGDDRGGCVSMADISGCAAG